MVLMPKEHGAYGQLTLPLLTALGAAGPSTTGLLVITSAVGAFIAHEPALILLGLRGIRARREFRAAAIRWLGISLSISVIAGALALVTIEPDTRWSVMVPMIPAFLLAVATAQGREKSWYGEVSAALAFAGLAVPVAMSAGAPPRTAAAIAVPFALLFITSTLAVRTVILQVRAGGNAGVTTSTRRSAFAVAGIGAAGLASLTLGEVLPPAAFAAAAPGLLVAVAIAARPPHATRLRSIGWTLVGLSVLTGVIVVVTVS